jgi:hypothetical protein
VIKVSPVSGDLLLKMALAAGAALLLWYALNRARGAVADAAGYVAALPGPAYDAFAGAVRVDLEPFADLGSYSPAVEDRWAAVQRGEARPSFWEDIKHLFAL